jgi:hypothetical protein
LTNREFSNSYTLAVQSQSYGHVRTDATHVIFGADGTMSAVRDQTHGRLPLLDAGYDMYEGICDAAIVDASIIARYTGVSWGNGITVGIFPVANGRVAWWVTRTVKKVTPKTDDKLRVNGVPTAESDAAAAGSHEPPVNYDPIYSKTYVSQLNTIFSSSSATTGGLWSGPIHDLIRGSGDMISYRHVYGRAPLVDRPYRSVMYTPPGAMAAAAIHPITLIGNAARPLPPIYLQVPTLTPTCLTLNDSLISIRVRVELIAYLL